MYICICSAVTDSCIREAVQKGACSLRDLRNELGVGSGCGKCVPQAYEVLSACLENKPGALTTPGAGPVYLARSV